VAEVTERPLCGLAAFALAILEAAKRPQPAPHPLPDPDPEPPEDPTT
jgi:hypothetical protein